MSEDKAKAKLLKAQRRAEKVAAKGADDSPAAPPGNGTAKKVVPSKKSDGPAKGSGSKKGVSAMPQEDTHAGATASRPVRTVALFSHLEQKKALNSEHIPKEIHPAVILLALQYSSGQCIGSNNRCIAMLKTFQQVIRDYITPPNLQTSLQRHLPTYLSAQISHLVTARPLSISMGSAIRLLKQQISITDIEASDEHNKVTLIDFIDTFIRERIEIAGQVIVKGAQERILDGDTILVYAHSTIVEAILVEAAKRVHFKVLVVDSRPKYEGKTMVRKLSKAGIPCTYIMITAIGYVMDTVDKVLLGAHTVLSNGAVYSRAGTAMIAMTASETHIPVIIACETYKFSDRVQLDSFVTNELGLTSELDLPRSSSPLLATTVDQKASKDPKTLTSTTAANGSASKQSNVLRLNLLYDVTPDKYITLCISELGSLPTTAIPFAALSEQNSV